MTRVAVVDHGMGNLRSVVRALEAAGAEAFVTADPGSTAGAAALCVPGQGIFARCMGVMRERDLAGEVTAWIDRGRPYLGICLGMQVLFSSSEEPPHIGAPPQETPGIGLLPGRVVRIPDSVTVPHIGWNEMEPADGGPTTAYYFDHSYAVVPDEESIVGGWCDHGFRWAALIRSGPILATQFHPEKSGRAGIDLLGKWVAGI